MSELGPVVFAYDGSDLAKGAIEETSRQLGHGRQAIVLTVWRPADVGFVPVRRLEIDAARADDVRKAAEATAADGAALAEACGIPSAERHERGGADVEGDRRLCRRA